MNPTLEVADFAQIKKASIEFGDLTVLVGAQGTGKSLLLQWLKVALDAGEIMAALRDAGHETNQTGAVLDLIFGDGMASAWRDTSRVTFRGQEIHPAQLIRRRTTVAHSFFIPAHRALLISDGWPAPFQTARKTS